MPYANNCLPVCGADFMKNWDEFTIKNEPISSVDLMERAATACTNWLLNKFPQNSFAVFCGNGNNGGDGMAIARLLINAGKTVSVHSLGALKDVSADNSVNWLQLPENFVKILSSNEWPAIDSNTIIVDALFGTGLNRPLKGFSEEVISFINALRNIIVSIDMPSGLPADNEFNSDASIIKANYTLTFQAPKLALLLPDAASFVGEWIVLDIQLSDQFNGLKNHDKWLLSPQFVKSLFKSPSKFDHKGTNGHALIIAGAASKYGAAIMATEAALRSGVGLLTVHVPAGAELIFQTACPQAMLSLDANETLISQIPLIDAYSAIGAGPGIGTHSVTSAAIKELVLSARQKLMLDADALNIIALEQSLLTNLPPNTLLTPHVKEFERLAGKANNAFHRHQMQLDFSRKHKVFILLKGAHSCLTTPDGVAFFNTSGNPGMAKGGAGDVLSGILTALLAQNYTVLEAALIGMYVHGLAGDLAAKSLGTVSMNASDIIDNIPEAFKSLQ